MLKKKSSSSEKKRKHSQSEERRDGSKHRSVDAKVEDSKDDLADPELDRIGSDIEDGGLDLSLPFQPITAYISVKQEMLQQCFRVLGDKKLRKMLPEELKDCTLEEIKKLCWEQLEPISEKHLFQILAGEELTSENDGKNTEKTLESQQDNNVDSTSCLKETAKTEDPKQEGAGGGSGEESDVLSINADTYDSDIEGSKEEQMAKAPPEKAGDKEGADAHVTSDPANAQPPAASQPVEAKKDIQSDIDKSVSEILALSSASGQKVTEGAQVVPPQATETSSSPVVEASASTSRAPTAAQPSIQQLELLELEMRARAIKALMKASDGKKLCLTKNP